MPDGFTKTDVEHVARLARLALSDAEQSVFTHQLARILDYAEQLQQVDTTGVDATTHVSLSGASTPERDDDPRAALSQAEALGNAPETAPAAGLFKVPRVLGA